MPSVFLSERVVDMCKYILFLFNRQYCSKGPTVHVFIKMTKCLCGFHFKIIFFIFYFIIYFLSCIVKILFGNVALS